MIQARNSERWSLLVLSAFVILVGPLLVGSSAESARAQASGCWKASIVDQWTHLGMIGSVLRVSVQGKSWLPVEIRSSGSFQTTGYTSTKPEYGPFVAEFAPLSKGIYYVEPQGLGIVFEVWLDGQNYTHVNFSPEPCALPTPTPIQRLPTSAPRVKVWPTPTVATATPLPPVPTPQPQPDLSWYGQVTRHDKNPHGVHWATIAVRIIGRPAGQEVAARAGDWSTVQKTGTKPEHGADACEFGALQPGTYRLSPTGLGTYVDVQVDRGDFVLVEFHRTEGSTSRWVGSVVENTSGSELTEHVNSAIAVVVSGRPWHEVEIQSDGWSTTAKTGHKPEYGPDACEFGALRAGTYTITPKGLDTSAQVAMDGWGWAMVRFDQRAMPAPQLTVPFSQPKAYPTQVVPFSQPQDGRPAPTQQPSPTPTGPRWRGWVVSNSSGEGVGTGIWSVVIVRVIDWVGVPVTITGGGGWSATCITGTKPEYGPDACEFGGLWPATYELRPEGSDVQVAVTMDGLGIAFVEFTAP